MIWESGFSILIYLILITPDQRESFNVTVCVDHILVEVNVMIHELHQIILVSDQDMSRLQYCCTDTHCSCTSSHLQHCLVLDDMLDRLKIFWQDYGSIPDHNTSITWDCSTKKKYILKCSTNLRIADPVEQLCSLHPRLAQSLGETCWIRRVSQLLTCHDDDQPADISCLLHSPSCWMSYFRVLEYEW